MMIEDGKNIKMVRKVKDSLIQTVNANGHVSRRFAD